MVIAYVTAKYPYGPGEAFIQAELERLADLGHDLVVLPVGSSRRAARHFEPPGSATVVRTGLLSRAVVAAVAAELGRQPLRTLGTLSVLRAGRPAVRAKNAAVWGEAVWAARRLRAARVEHVHAYWAGTTATVAMTAARLAGMPWSFTAHRWDIDEDNALREKIGAACFVRAIDERGAAKLRAAARDDDASRVAVVHLGVELPAAADVPERDRPLLVAANLVPVKGHEVFLRALTILRERGAGLRAEIAGDGPLASGLAATIARLGLGDAVRMVGHVPHDTLLRDLAGGRYSAVVLPSLELPSGETEGIPVTLMEAMARAVPVVASRVGGIPELVADGTGLLVPPGDPAALADAVERVARDAGLAARLALAGRERVRQAFSVDENAGLLLESISRCAEPA